LNAAVKRRLIPWNPALHVELPTGARPDTTVWTPEQLARFLDHVADHRLYALFHLVAFAGLRRGEVLGLRWQDVDFNRGTMIVRQQLVDIGHGLRFGPPKTRSGQRPVALDPVTVEVLEVHQKEQSAEREAWGRHGSTADWSSPARTGAPPAGLRHPSVPPSRARSGTS
jgi:integrase